MRVRFRPRFALDRRQQSLVLWGAWLLTTAAFFSVAGFFHSYYMVTMAPSIAALAGIGVVSLWRDYRAAGWRAHRHVVTPPNSSSTRSLALRHKAKMVPYAVYRRCATIAEPAERSAYHEPILLRTREERGDAIHVA
jgi:hypothetical protein